MIVNFTLFRSKYPDEEIVTGNIKQPIEDTILISLDTYINKLIISSAYSLEIIKSYGIAYVGSIKINSIEITDEDDIALNEEGFNEYINCLFTNIIVKWNKKTNNTTKDKKSTEIDPSVNE